MEIIQNKITKFAALKDELISTNKTLFWGKLTNFKWGGDEVINILNLK
jgi:hypothetical protein